MVSKRKSRSKGKPKAETGKKERDQDTIRQINAALDANPVRIQFVNAATESRTAKEYFEYFV